MLIGARDPIGIRPLVLGERAGALILASETCALDMIGAKFVRSIEPGEVVVITRAKDGEVTVDSHFPFPRRKARPCIFEFVYFARPDSIVDGRSVYDIRKRMGMRARARDRRRKPMSSCRCRTPACRPRWASPPQAASRTNSASSATTMSAAPSFSRSRKSAHIGVRLKHSANRDVIKGKRVVLVDDSIVRGTTSRKIVQMVREAGAKEVHFRSASPPIKLPDFYGIDMPALAELMAAQMTLEEMRKSLGVDSWASSRSRASIGRWAKRSATPPTRNSPTTPSPAITQRRCWTITTSRAGRDSQLPLLAENAAE